MYRLLIVEDDKDVLLTNEIYMKSHGYHVLSASDADSALRIARSAALDCVLLDIGLPGMDGYEVYSRIREFSMVPVIFLTAYSSMEQKLAGLKLGADDYICKPYNLEELELRVRIRIERTYGLEPQDILTFGTLTIDLKKRTVSCLGNEAELSALEFDLLAFMAKHPEQVFSYEQLCDRVWKVPIGTSRHTVQVGIARVRHKLDALCPSHSYIRTNYGKGYQFSP